MACKKFILKTLFICLQVLSKFTTKYHSTETTVSIHSEVRGFLGRKKFQRKSNLQYNYKYSCEHILIQAVKRTENSHESNFNLLSAH